jgi:hypothetical protein
MTTYALIKSAIAALPSPAPTDAPTLTTMLNSQSTPGFIDINCSDLEKIIVPTGEFFAIYKMSLMTLSGQTPPTTMDQVIGIAWNFYRMVTQWNTIQTSNAELRASCVTAMGALQAAALLSATSQTAIEALWSVMIPDYAPALQVIDVETAQEIA